MRESKAQGDDVLNLVCVGCGYKVEASSPLRVCPHCHDHQADNPEPVFELQS